MARKEKLPFETTLMVRDCCLCMHMQRAARNLARIFDDVLRPLDLTNGQFSLLMSLNRPRPAPMKSVASLLAMDRTTLTAALKPLERRGLVTIVQDPDDRRSRLLELTQAGHDLLAEAFPLWQQTHAEIERPFAPGEVDQLRGQLRALSVDPAARATAICRYTLNCVTNGADSHPSNAGYEAIATAFATMLRRPPPGRWP